MDFRWPGLETTPIQLAAAVDPQPLPLDAQRVAVIPVLPGDMVPLPFEAGMAARLGENGNLAIKSGDLTIILQGYVAANLREPVTILAANNDVLDVAALIEATGPDVDIQTAIGSALAPPARPDPDVSGNGIFEPFIAPGALGPLRAAGVLDDTDPILGEPEVPARGSPTPDLLSGLAGAPVPAPPGADDLALTATEDGPPVQGNFTGDDPDPEDQGKLTFALLTQPAEGSVTDNKDATFSFDPGADFQDLAEGETRAVVFQYTATDPSGLVSPPATVTVTVSGVNDAPAVADLSLSAKEDGPMVGDAFAGDDADSDDDQKSLTYAISGQPAAGAVTDNGDGTFTFDPGADFQGLAEGETQDVGFTYTATDRHGSVSNTGAVVITVTGVNDAPIVQDVALAAEEGGLPVDGKFVGDDADSDDDPASLTYVITGQSGAGTIINNGDGTFTFDPGPDFSKLREGDTGTTTFSYVAIDSHAAISNTGSITVVITGTDNTAPTAENLKLAAMEDGPAVSAAFLGDDADKDDDPTTLSYLITQQPAEGTATNNKDGTFTFDPGADFQDLAEGETRDVTFKYRSVDSHADVSQPATVTVTVTGVNDAPTSENIKLSAEEDGAPVAAAFDSDDIDSDDDPATLAYALTSQPAEGTVTDNGDGTFTFDPGADFQDLAEGETRDVTFTYKATDQHGAASNAGTITVTVTGVNDAPVVGGLTLNAKEDGAPVSAAFDGDDADSDDDPASLKYVITTTPPAGQGAVTNNADGTFTFDPGADFQDLAEGETRDVTFQYTATDQHGAVSAPALVTITVTGVNDTPAVDDQAVAVKEDGGPVSVAFKGDDADSDDDPASLTYTILTPPSAGQGTLTDNGDGTFTFDPGKDFQELAEGETEELTFKYTATDQHGATSNDGTITVTVTGVNDAPVAQNIALKAQEDGPAVISAFQGDDSDSDDDPASLKYAITSQPAAGTLVDNGDGTFSFDPGKDFQDLAVGASKDVTFTYTATDAHGAGSNTATVTITVIGANDAPVAQNIALKAQEDGLAVISAFKGDDADSDDDPASLNYAIASQPAGGTLINNGDGTFSFDPGKDFQDLAVGASRDVTFTYTATDSHGAGSNTATVTITVIGANDAPVAQDIALKAQEDGPAVISAFIGDDADSDDDPASLKYAITSQPAGGTLTNNGNGTFSFDPGKDFQDLAVGASRDVTFTYTVTDSHGAGSNTATVTITVIGANDAPTVNGLSSSVKEGDKVTTAFIADDIDSDDSPATLSYAIVSQPSAGTVTVNPDGTFTFDTGEDFDDLLVGQTRTVTFTYVATDSHGVASAPATVTITVSGANVIPPDPNACLPPADQLAKYTYVPGTIGNDTLNPGGNNNLWIQGFDGDDKLTGAGLADLLEGGEGNDTLDGGSGNDVMLGGKGNDTIRGGDASDCIGAGDGDDTVDGGTSNDNLRGDAGNDIITGGDGEDTIQGGDGKDTLSGNQGQDILAGGEGDDTLNGNEGDDKVDGGAGNDLIFGEQGNDRNLDGGDGDDEILGGEGDDVINGGADNDKLSGDNGNDIIDGGTGNDIIFGGNGDDKLTGGDGVDILEGGQGHDIIDGQPGTVTVRYSDILDVDGLGDQIVNFDTDPAGGRDVIDLDLLFDSLEATAGPLSAQARSDLLSFVSNNGAVDIFIDADANAATAPILLATVTADGPLAIGTTIIVDSP